MSIWSTVQVKARNAWAIEERADAQLSCVWYQSSAQIQYGGYWRSWIPDFSSFVEFVKKRRGWRWSEFGNQANRANSAGLGIYVFLSLVKPSHQFLLYPRSQHNTVSSDFPDARSYDNLWDYILRASKSQFLQNSRRPQTIDSLYPKPPAVHPARRCLHAASRRSLWQTDDCERKVWELVHRSGIEGRGRIFQEYGWAYWRLEVQFEKAEFTFARNHWEEWWVCYIVRWGSIISNCIYIGV